MSRLTPQPEDFRLKRTRLCADKHIAVFIFADVSIGDYTEVIKMILGECAKYFVVLLLTVLAIRMWRRLRVLSDRRTQNALLAALFTVAGTAAAYSAIQHSLGRLYSHYGFKAFYAGHLKSAAGLFETSAQHWSSADALGNEGVCFLLLNEGEMGLRLLDQAKAMRDGTSTRFQQFYEGVFYFFREQPARALPLLEAASSDLAFRWDATKLLAVIHAERKSAAEATRLMDPYRQVEVKEFDHAYALAYIDVLQGKKTDALAMLDKCSSATLPRFWKARYDKLREQARPD